MLDDHLYNLMTQLTQEHKSVWRIRKFYEKDAGNCIDCVKFWEKMAEDKEAHIRVIEEELRKHIENEKK